LRDTGITIALLSAHRGEKPKRALIEVKLAEGLAGISSIIVLWRPLSA